MALLALRLDESHHKSTSVGGARGQSHLQHSVPQGNETCLIPSLHFASHMHSRIHPGSQEISCSLKKPGFTLNHLGSLLEPELVWQLCPFKEIAALAHALLQTKGSCACLLESSCGTIRCNSSGFNASAKSLGKIKHGVWLKQSLQDHSLASRTQSSLRRVYES